MMHSNMNVKFITALSSYRTLNTFNVGFRNQTVTAA